MNKDIKELQVAALENGTVIDHIPCDKLFAVVKLLKLDQMKEPVTIGFNLKSSKLGKKGIIKIANRFFTNDEINRISVVAPNVVLNVIRDYKVAEKHAVVMQDTLKGIVRCKNPQCITNNEPMQTVFHWNEDTHKLTCHYCQKEQDPDDVKLV